MRIKKRLIILGLLAVIVASKDYVLTQIIVNTAKKYKIACYDVSAGLGLRGLWIKADEISLPGFRAKFKRVTVSYGWRPGLASLKLIFDDATVKISQHKGNNFNSQIRFNAELTVFKDLAPSFKSLEIIYAEFMSQDLQITDVVLPAKNENQILKIGKIRYKEEVLHSLQIPVEVVKHGIVLPRSVAPLLGPIAHLQGSIIFATNKDIDANFYLEQASFSRVVSFISGKNQIILQGGFNGKVELKIKDRELVLLNGALTNIKGGIINVRNDQPLSMIKENMDSYSYRALIDNLKNYRYNTGLMRFNTHDKVISLILDFNSQDMGQRNIIINLHTVSGGGS